MLYSKLYFRFARTMYALRAAFRLSLAFRTAVIVTSIVGLSLCVNVGVGNAFAPSNASGGGRMSLVTTNARGGDDKGNTRGGAIRVLTRWCLTPSGYQEIAPCHGTASAPTGASGSFDFTITNTDTVNDVGYDDFVTCTGVSVTCSTSGSG